MRLRWCLALAVAAMVLGVIVGSVITAGKPATAQTESGTWHLEIIGNDADLIKWQEAEQFLESLDASCVVEFASNDEWIAYACPLDT